MVQKLVTKFQDMQLKVLLCASGWVKNLLNFSEKNSIQLKEMKREKQHITLQLKVYYGWIGYPSIKKC